MYRAPLAATKDKKEESVNDGRVCFQMMGGFACGAELIIKENFVFQKNGWD